MTVQRSKPHFFLYPSYEFATAQGTEGGLQRTRFVLTAARVPPLSARRHRFSLSQKGIGEMETNTLGNAFQAFSAEGERMVEILYVTRLPHNQHTIGRQSDAATDGGGNSQTRRRARAGPESGTASARLLGVEIGTAARQVSEPGKGWGHCAGKQAAGLEHW